MTGLNRFLDVAKRAAYQAGRFLLENLDGGREIYYKGEGHKNPALGINPAVYPKSNTKPRKQNRDS